MMGVMEGEDYSLVTAGQSDPNTNAQPLGEKTLCIRLGDFDLEFDQFIWPICLVYVSITLMSSVWVSLAWLKCEQSGFVPISAVSGAAFSDPPLPPFHGASEVSTYLLSCCSCWNR